MNTIAKNIASAYPKSNIITDLTGAKGFSEKMIDIAPAGGCANPNPRVVAIPTEVTAGTRTHTGRIDVGINVLAVDKLEVIKMPTKEFRGCDAGEPVSP